MAQLRGGGIEAEDVVFERHRPFPRPLDFADSCIGLFEDDDSEISAAELEPWELAIAENDIH